MASKLASAAAIFVLLLFPHHGVAQEPYDPYGLRINIGDVCDLRPNGSSKMSDKCYGFIGAVAEIVKTNQLYRDNRIPGSTCIPDGLNIEELYEAIRPALIAGRACFGTCTSTDLVMSTLAHTFPCKH